MIAFAGNSLLTRLALSDQSIDPYSFTTIRVLTGAVMLFALVKIKSIPLFENKSWLGAFALFFYALTFSIAYLKIETGTGALILFVSVQICLSLIYFIQGARYNYLEWTGLILAFFGFIYFLAPSFESPSLIYILLMVLSGICWAFYTVTGGKSLLPIADTATHFIRASLIAVVVSCLFISEMKISPLGALYAVLSGGVTSALGYALWYFVITKLEKSITTVSQLSVPLIAAFMGFLMLGETIDLHFIFSSILMLCAIAIVAIGAKGRS